MGKVAIFRKKGRTAEERFDDLWKLDRKSGCWLWVGSCFGSGYGNFTVGEGKHEHAHRSSWKRHKGRIPKGLMVLHKCDVRKCVNPEHLFIGTAADNAQDMYAKGRENNVRGERHPRAVLTEEDVRSIRADTRKLADIGQDYGFDRQYVWCIKHRKYWSHVA